MTNKVKWLWKTFPDNTQPLGFLPDKKGAQACWWNFIRLHKIYKTAGSIESQTGTLLEGDDWRLKRYLEIKRATGIVYELDPDYIDRFWPEVTKEAQRLGRERFEFTGEPFELPEKEYMEAKPGMIFEGYEEKKTRSNIIILPTGKERERYGK